MKSLTVDDSGRAPCPVCGTRVYFFYALPGEDVTYLGIPLHSEGLIGSARGCGVNGLPVWQALEMADILNEDPKLPLRAHP